MTLDQALDACPLGPATGARRAAFASVAARNNWPVTHLSIRQATALWVLDFLYGQIGAEDACVMVMSIPITTLDEISYETGSGQMSPGPTITVTDKRYVGFTHVANVYYVTGTEWVRAVPSDWFETRVFNVGPVVRACLERVTSGTRTQD